MKVCLITIGDEILIGQIIDSNSAWIARQLYDIDGHVIEIVSLPDEKNAILSGLKRSFESADVILMTGGLGPTNDDITNEVLATFFDVKLSFHAPTFARIDRMFKQLNIPLTDNNRQQCFMPENAILLQNKMGTAPGMWFEKNGTILVAMPGVPYEMKWIMQNEVLPRLNNLFPGSPVLHRTLLTSGIGESNLATKLASIESALPKEITIAYLPKPGQVRIRLTAKGINLEQLDHLLEKQIERIALMIPEFLIGIGDLSLSEFVGKLLLDKHLSVGTSESCTGGLLAHKFTSVAGSSAYYLGSVVAYSNEVKNRILNVDRQILDTYGAVSENTVIEMVKGTLNTIHCDIAVATSGIAGPSGGTPEKPVGTIWIAVGNKDRIITKILQRGKDRHHNIEYTANYALFMVFNFIRKYYK